MRLEKLIDELLELQKQGYSDSPIVAWDTELKDISPVVKILYSVPGSEIMLRTKEDEIQAESNK